MPLSRYKIILALFLLLYTLRAQAQVASFSMDASSGCTPLVVHFTNTSTGATSYSWNLGNTTTTTLTDVSTAYITPGTYTVTLTAYSGASSSTHTSVITVYPLPTVSFSVDDTTVCPGTNETYLNTSSGNMPGAVSYTWNFGDGSTAAATAPIYAHSLPGYYNISLFAQNAAGCTASLTKPSYIHVYTPPVANISGSSTVICHPPQSVLFSNASTGSLPLTYNWQFGDGGTSASVSPSHTYTAAGNYDVRLSVTDAHGCQNVVTNAGFVFVSGIKAGFSSATGVCDGGAFSFIDTSHSIASLSYAWSFGDGHTATDVNPVYQYAVPGTYPVKLTVTDGLCTDTVTHTVNVYPIPTGTINISPAIPCPPPVNITYSAGMPSGCTAAWRFMAGTVAPATGTGTTITKLVNTAIIDTVFLTVTSSHGCVAEFWQMDTTFEYHPRIMATNWAGCIPVSTSLYTDPFTVTTSSVTGMPVDPGNPYVISSYAWNFADGSATASGPSPSHTYTAVGVYNANVSVVTTSGCNATATAPIRAGIQPTVACTAAPTHICAGKYIYFTSTGSPTITTYKYLYGDGMNDSGGVAYANISHLYYNPVSDTARIIAYYNGCPSPEVKIPIIADSPNAVPTFSYDCIPRNAVTFGDASIGVTSRLWLLGDGDTSSSPLFTHHYASLANYDVSLTTYNSTTGCRDTLTTQVKLAPPFLYFVAPDPVVCIHESTAFYGTAVGTDVVQYRWYVDNLLVDTTSGSAAALPFDSPGWHDMTMVIIDERGCFDTLTQTHYVLTGNPTDSFAASPAIGCGPLPVTFLDLSSDVAGIPITNYTWTFGDGFPDVSSTSPGITHTFDYAGTYSVTLNVTDSIGCSSSAETPIPVLVHVNRPTGLFFADMNNVCMGTAVHFNNISPSIVSSFWMFGDGNTSTATHPYHAYSAPGYYTVQLVVTDANGCTDTATLLNYIYVANSPHASFTMSDSFAVCPPLNVAFTNTSTGGVTWRWDFGNASSSIIANPTAPYSASGLYNVQLVAYNSIGCTDTARHQVNIFGYTGAFHYTPLSGCEPLSVHFDVVLGSVAGLTWDFGDGYTSTVSLQDTISHTYTSLGAFVPKLILTDTTGCTNVSVGSDTIKSDAVTAAFRINPLATCAGNSITFTDSSYGAFSTPVAWSWQFDDATTATGSAVSHTFTLAGTHVATLTTTGSSGCTGMATRSFTINPLPDTIAGVATVCPGLTTTLTDATVPGTWSGGSPTIGTISSSGVVTGIGLGTTVVTYTIPTGCKVTRVVTVYTLPAALTGANVLCSGDTATFHSATAGGSWSTSDASVASVNPVSGKVTATGAGSAIITYSLGTGCIAVRSVTVNAVPGPIGGTHAVCDHSTAILYQLATSGVWSSSNPAVLSVDVSGNITGQMPGTATVSYTYATGCGVTYAVTVNPRPDTITGDVSICHGTLGFLHTTSTGGTWSSTTPSVASVYASGMIAGVAPGTAVIIYTFPNTCTRVTEVTINPIPAGITGTLTACVAVPTHLSSLTPGGFWSSDDPSVATIDPSTGVYSGIAPGTATISYTMPTGCATSTIVTLQSLPPAIQGGDQVCAGFALNLTDSMPGGVWTIDPFPTIIASIHPVTGVISGITPGIVTVNYTIATGCRSSQIVTVVVLPAVIGGENHVCVASSTTLTNSTTGGTWSSSNPAVATVDVATGTVTGVSAGSVVITYHAATNCFNVLHMTVNPLPAAIAGANHVCAGSVISLSSATPGGVWISGNTDTATVTSLSGFVTGIGAGTVAITYQLPTGCRITHGITVDATPPAITGNLHICPAISNTLANAMPGGSWSSSNPSVAVVGSASGVVSPVTLGTAAISYVLTSTGCYAVKIVTVHPLPTVYAVTGGGTYCAGSGGVAIGLAGSQAGVSYVLYNGASAAGYVPGTGFPITFGSLAPAGIYTVMATGAVSGCMQAMSGSALVTITPLSDPSVTLLTTPGDSVCPGSSVLAVPSTVHAGTAPSFAWKVNGSLVSTGGTYSFLPADGDIISVILTSNDTCLSTPYAVASQTIHVLPSALPVVEVHTFPGDTVCMHSPITLNATAVYGGASPRFYWYANTSLFDSGLFVTYTPTQGDIVWCEMKSDYLCRTADAVFSGALTIYTDTLATPIVTITANPGLDVAYGIPVTLTANATDVGPLPAWQWRVNGHPVAGATNQSYTAIFNDNDSVACQVLSSGYCGNISSFGWVFVSNYHVGVVQVGNQRADIRLLPNPNDGTFRIVGTLSGVSANKEVAISITDMLGRKVYAQTALTYQGSIDVPILLDPTLANGMYIAEVSWPGGNQVIHFVLSK